MTVPHPDVNLAAIQTPFDDDTITALAARVSTAQIVGLATTTREGAETFALQFELFRALVAKGFRLLVIQDSDDVADRYNRYVTGHDESLMASLAQAWGPWRVRPMLDVLRWLRHHNADHPADPVHVMGMSPGAASPADYSTVLGLVSDLPSKQRKRIGDVFDTIVVAHAGGEHVERAQGRYDGPAFVDLARSVHDLVAASTAARRDEALMLLDRIVTFHAQSVSQGLDLRAVAAQSAERILRAHRASGARAVIWDGVAHLAANLDNEGAALRRELGDGYKAVAITFGGGSLRDFRLPPLRDDSIEARLQELGDVMLDLDSSPENLPDWLTQPGRFRMISGMYRPDEDTDHYFETPSVAAGFSDIVHIRHVSPITGL